MWICTVIWTDSGVEQAVLACCTIHTLINPLLQNYKFQAILTEDPYTVVSPH
jgi:hypothetical protein